MSRTIEIPRRDWQSYLETLSKRSQDAPVRIELDSRDLGEQQLVRDAQLIGIQYEARGSEQTDIEVVVETEGGSLEHHIDRPRRVFVLQGEAGQPECVAIEDKEGGQTLVYFERRPSLQPGEPEPAQP